MRPFRFFSASRPEIQCIFSGQECSYCFSILEGSVLIIINTFGQSDHGVGETFERHRVTTIIIELDVFLIRQVILVWHIQI